MSLKSAGMLASLTGLATFAALAAVPGSVRAQGSVTPAELDRLEADIQRAEDVSAIKRLQRAYGYYVDKGLWADVAALFADDAVANYPAGIYVGKESIRKHLFLNVGGVEMGETGLGDGRLYDHMNVQPVVHLDPGGQTARGRWRAFAMFGTFGGSGIWAEGVYEMTYVKDAGVWKIQTLDYYPGFGAPYETGWVDPGTGSRRSGPRNLPHPPDRERDNACEGFPDACIAPFHYTNPGTTDGGHVWTDEGAGDVRGGDDVIARAGELARRAERLSDEQALENLQRIYGYYIDQGLWHDAARLFADDGTIELGLQGVYRGPEHIAAFLALQGPEGGADGWLNDHVQLQILASVGEDGRTAKTRSRELAMTGVYDSHGEWSAGIYENTYIKVGGHWTIQSMRFYPTFVASYEGGWTGDAEPLPGVSETVPPDAPPTERYEIYPKAHIPPYHYPNPVTGEPPVYPSGDGRPNRAAIRAATASVAHPNGRAPRLRLAEDTVGAAVAEAERRVARVKDYDELENLESAYGYYLDKNLWNDLADLFAEDSSMELAQRGVYSGPGRVRGFLLAVFGRGGEGPVEGQLGNHIQWQPVISVAADGQSAKIRSRMYQQMTRGGRASMGAAVYENTAIKEDGRWKFKSEHAFNTWGGSYENGWVRNASGYVPGPSADYPPDAPPTLEFRMFPTVYRIPFHYGNPADMSIAPGEPGGMPVAVANALYEIGARIETERTGQIYAALLPKNREADVRVERDLAYGPNEQQVLDVFTDETEASGRPVVVFVHGGGFTRGQKSEPGSPFYDNVMRWAVHQGLVGVNIDYRLAPAFQWPSGIEDLGRVRQWIEAHIADYGGDPSKVFFWGHSAGAAHVGDYIADCVRKGEATGLAGAILTSGFYRLGDTASIWQSYYGDDVSRYAERSAFDRLVATDLPLFVNDAELDPESFGPESRELVEARRALGKPVSYVHLLGHSHISETYAVGTSDESLSGPVRAFIDENL